MKRKSSKGHKKSPARKRGGERRDVPPLVGTMLDIIEEVTFAFGVGGVTDYEDPPTLKKLNHHNQL